MTEPAHTKAELLDSLRDIHARWKAFLEELDPKHRATLLPGSVWTLTTSLAHLAAWQQVTRARLYAALQHRAPEYPVWLQGISPETDEQIDLLNERIYQLYKGLSWDEAVQLWNTSFADVIAAAEAIPEDVLLQAGRFSWLDARYPIGAVLVGTTEHHTEHLEAALSAFKAG